ARPRGERLAHVARVVLHRENEDLRARRRLMDLGRRLEPAAPGHDDVEQHDVRLVQPGEPDGVVGAAALVLDDDVLLGFEEQAQAGAHQRMVVHDQHGNHGNGTSTTNVDPAPGLDSIRSRPPSKPTRSRMPTSPSPPSRVRSGSKPTPSSSTTTDTESSFRVRTTLTAVARACLTTFVSASWTIR